MATVIVMVALLALGFGRGAQAATLTVANTNDGGIGSLRQAIADAAPGDTINFDTGLTGQTITLTTGALLISKNLTITGPSGGVTISGNHASQVLGISGAVYISNITIADGNTYDSGGGIVNGGTLTLTNSTVSGNTVSFYGGGGIYNTGKLIVSSSKVTDNSAGYIGGGIYNNGGTVNVSNSTISGNATNGGGGIYNDYGILIVSDSTVSGNSANIVGGGIDNNGGTLTLTNSTVSGNSASSGGGIDNSRGATATLMNSTISGNSGSSGGGAGGIYNDGHSTLTNSVVADQIIGGDCRTPGGTLQVSLGYNLDSDGTCNLTAVGDLPNTNPMLGPLALNAPGTTQTHALQPGSPAIDHIPPSVNGCGTTVSTDQRGVSRPQGSGCDIGAYELLVSTPVPTPAPVGGLVALPVSDSGSGSMALPVAVMSAALAVVVGGWYSKRRRLR